MSYRITVSARFEAAHNLIDYSGGPEPLHGHSYKVDIVLETEALPQQGLAVDFVADFKLLKQVMRPVVDYLDHQMINDLEPFTTLNPSAENLARYFAERLEESAALQKASVAEVTVWEGPKNRATYVPVRR